MPNRLTMLLAAGLGATAMYYLDPARGRYRRSLLRDKLAHARREARHGIGIAGRDLQHRAVGKTAGVLSQMRSGRRPDDRVLAERVRACLGRVVTHPSSIHVEAADGTVTLYGPILQHEVRPLLGCVVGVHGVRDVRSRLDVYSEPGRIPGLQGMPRPTAEEAAAMRGWSPAGRAVAGLAGGAAAAYGLRRGGATGALLGMTGVAMLGRALTNLDARRLFGVGTPVYAITVQKSIRINAPVEQVFGLWQDFERFPSFMTHVQRVRRLDGMPDEGEHEAQHEGEQGGEHAEQHDGERWRWTVRGRGGIESEFDSVVTEREENRLLAWRTDDGAFIGHMGRVLFHPNEDGSTSIDVKMIYHPIGGAVGHAVARLLGADPKHQMDDDLLRFKSFLETGKMPRDAARRATEIASSREARIARGKTVFGETRGSA
jgi:uncharacterized membrane protein